MRDTIAPIIVTVIALALIAVVLMCGGCGIASYSDGETSLFIGRLGVDTSVEGAHFEKGPDGIIIAADKADSVTREDLLKAILDKLP